MNADRRIVPSHHVTSVLAEEHMTERAIEMKQKLKDAPNAINKVADKWAGHNGLNPLSRVILKHAPKIPEATKKHHTHSPANHIVNKHSGHEAHHGHDAHGHGHEAHHGHDAHGHGHEAHHGHDAHGHGHEAHHGHDAHGHGHEAHHGHDAHGHGHEAHHGHDAHGHGHEAHHGHDAHGHGHEAHHGHDAHGHGHEAHHGHDAHGYMSQYCGIVFGMFGRIIGSILDYIIKLLFILMIFGPTRSAIIAMVVSWSINSFGSTNLPTLLITTIVFVAHGVFSGAARLAQSNGEHGGGGHGHGHDDHGHSGGHGHDDHGHGGHH